MGVRYVFDLRAAHRGVAVLFLVSAVMVAACGGSTASSGPSGAAASDVPVASDAPAATETAASPSADAGSSVTTLPSIGAIPSFDVSDLIDNLANVDSYRVAISVDGVEQFSGTVVTKPKLARKITLSDGTTLIIIGDETWMSQDGQTFVKTPGDFVNAMIAGLDPSILVAAFSGPGWAESALSVGHEQKNGVDATHYRIDSSTLFGGFTGVPDGASVDLWISDDGILVAWESTGFGGPGENVSLQVTNIDDPSNKVEAPN
jgi:hypothetical protein